MSNPKLKITPVGGVGQIGSNMTLIEFNQQRIMIDAGILFPYEDFFDINYLIPNLSKIPPPEVLVITHGHEDHIGAIYNVITAFPEIKVYAPSFAALLIRRKLEYNKISHSINVYKENDNIQFNELEIHPIHVNHSIPQTFGLFFKFVNFDLGFLFVSDFKIDFKTKYEKPFDFYKLNKVSAGLSKKILFADSTNILSSQSETPSEWDVIPSLEKIISESQSRIFITLFSSNVHRIRSILDLAEKYQFKVVPHGRSMISYIKSAQEDGILENYDRILKSHDQVKNKEENIIALLSGCQGDFLGTFRRVAMGEDSTFKLRSTDTVVLSSKPIPGNEKKISMMTNKLSEVGCKVITPADMLIHVSGHPGKKDLEKLYHEFAPTDIVPIHGETLFIREHIEHIKAVYPQANAHFILNFDEIHIDDKHIIKITQGEKLDPIIYHGKNIQIEKDKISERRKLACNGAVFLSLKIEHQKISHSCHPKIFI
jgi:ribonuclease J